VLVLAQHHHMAIFHLGVDQYVIWKSNGVVVRNNAIVRKPNRLYGHFANRTAAEHDLASYDFPWSEISHCGTSIFGLDWRTATHARCVDAGSCGPYTGLAHPPPTLVTTRGPALPAERFRNTTG
jgi:hypothetical protein